MILLILILFHTLIISTENPEFEEETIKEYETISNERIISETIKDEHNDIVESTTNIETHETKINPLEESDILEQVSLSVMSSNLVSNLVCFVISFCLQHYINTYIINILYIYYMMGKILILISFYFF